MKKIEIGKGKISGSEIGLGCMRITGLPSVKEVRNLVDTAMDCGIDFLTMRISMQEARQSRFSDRP